MDFGLCLCVSESQRKIKLNVFGVCTYLIVEDDHDKHAKQHRLHQQDDVVSTGSERGSHRQLIDTKLQALKASRTSHSTLFKKHQKAAA